MGLKKFSIEYPLFVITDSVTVYGIEWPLETANIKSDG